MTAVSSLRLLHLTQIDEEDELELVSLVIIISVGRKFDLLIS